jgi:hypothetical protein
MGDIVHVKVPFGEMVWPCNLYLYNATTLPYTAVYLRDKYTVVKGFVHPFREEEFGGGRQ